ncbi:hypothetical protein L9F63_006229, partial [Diploptera punctata]
PESFCLLILIFGDQCILTSQLISILCPLEVSVRLEFRVALDCNINSKRKPLRELFHLGRGPVWWCA